MPFFNAINFSYDITYQSIISNNIIKTINFTNTIPHDIINMQRRVIKLYKD